ncbi:hypothetical protein ACQ4M4_25780 [Leptolyngbya sp. AN02str]|uniref:hypothetical protein n=1 Tax=Leptolyngbya sp. AN02str TaxID=3423363 RepID=UPI003D31FA70
MHQSGLTPHEHIARITLLSEAVETELAELWAKCEGCDRILSSSALAPVVTFDGSTLRISSRAIALETNLRQVEAA